jgi:uncharacterized protein YbaR (Trm112 family)
MSDKGIEKGKLFCEECNAFFTVEDILRAESPFDPQRMLGACPKCKEIERYVSLCDEPGCYQQVSGGHPDPVHGYRNTCFDHGKYMRGKQ